MSVLFSEVKAAVRIVAEEYAKLPQSARCSIAFSADDWRQLERDLDLAIGRGHLEEARAALARWQGRALREIASAWQPELEAGESR